jgi:DNA-binding MarR family transcriptional regulator
MLYAARVRTVLPGVLVTSTHTAGRSRPATDRSTALTALSEQLPRMGRVIHGFKAQQASEGRDRAALVLLFPLARLGPLRQGALAELVHADPSTVSRHVAALVERGLVSRAADETDGRASRLVVTDAGHAALDQLRRERETQLARATAGWSDADLATLTTLFDRLLDDLAAALPALGDCAGSPSPAAPRENR